MRFRAAPPTLCTLSTDDFFSVLMKRLRAILKACAGRDTTLVLLMTSGLAHLPPIKIVTILSGALQVGLAFFIASCVIARGARFLALAWALRRYGEQIRTFIEKRLALVAGIGAIVLILLYFAVKWLAGSGGLSTC